MASAAAPPREISPKRQTHFLHSVCTSRVARSQPQRAEVLIRFSIPLEVTQPIGPLSRLAVLINCDKQAASSDVARNSDGIHRLSIVGDPLKPNAAGQRVTNNLSTFACRGKVVRAMRIRRVHVAVLLQIS